MVARLLVVLIPLVLLAIVVFVLAAVMAVVSRFSSGQSLAKRFSQLGDMTGRSEQEFAAALGFRPTSISTDAHGGRLLQWQDSGQHLAVLFTPDHRLVRITHRHRV